MAADILDHPIIEFADSYDACVTRAGELVPAIAVWFLETHAEGGPSHDQTQHVVWRCSVERGQHGRTPREVLQGVWPKPLPVAEKWWYNGDCWTHRDQEGTLFEVVNERGEHAAAREDELARIIVMPWGVVGEVTADGIAWSNGTTWLKEAPYVALPRLVARGHYFVTDRGERFTAICATGFVLNKMTAEGRTTERDAYLDQLRDLGFNMVRDFCAQEWGDPAYDVLPTTHPNFYDSLARTAEACAARGLYYLAVAFAGWQPPREQQLEHWARFQQALEPYPNAVPSLVNENDASGFLDTSIFSQPAALVSSHGSNGSQALAVRPWWTWEAFHTNGASEEQRKIGHNAMELCDGTPDFPPSRSPVITDETSRYPEVGMWVNRTQADRENLAWDSAAGAALLCAGSCFHSVNAKLCRPFDDAERRVAAAWVTGARSVPLEYQDGVYVREDRGFPEQFLRKYGRKFADGRAHWVTIRW